MAGFRSDHDLPRGIAGNRAGESNGGISAGPAHAVKTETDGIHGDAGRCRLDRRLTAGGIGQRRCTSAPPTVL